jgi:uncharacterized protein (TIGR03067 family)
MRLSIALIIAAGLLVTGTSLGQDAAQKDLAALKGSWEIIGKEYMGKKATREEVAKLKGDMVIKDNTVTQWADDAGQTMVVSVAAWKLDPKANPKALDLTYTEGELKGETVPAIYELKGDTLKVCYAMMNEKRPTEFAGKADGKAFLLIYKRVKK